MLRLADDVHYVYRHDGAMVLLRQECLADWERSRAAEARRAPDAGTDGPRSLKDLLRAGRPAAAVPTRPPRPGGDLSAP